jgi:hypothetical protein
MGGGVCDDSEGDGYVNTDALQVLGSFACSCSFGDTLFIPADT